MTVQFLRTQAGRLRRAAVLATALLGLTAGGALPGQAETLQKITVGIPEAIKIDYAFLAFATALGYFAEEGIEIEIIALDGSAVLIPQVANKNIDVAFVNPGLLVLAVSRNEPFPVRYLYNHYRSQVFQIITKADSDVAKLEDLQGRAFGVPSLAGGEIPLVKLIFATAGIAWDDLEVLPTGFGPAAWRRLADGEIDGWVSPVAEAERVQISGTPVRRLELLEPFNRLFANGFIAHNDRIAGDAALLAAFGRAVAKGTTACEANLDNCLKAYWTLDPNAKPASEADQAQWLSQSRQLLGAIFGSALKLQPGNPDLWGNYPDGAWQQLFDTMEAGGQIESADLDASLLHTNELIEEINDFDRGAVEQDANKPL